VKKLLGGNDVEAVLQRLDRLTLEEARTTAAQNLEAVYSLVQSMREIMDGEPIPTGRATRRLSSVPLDGKVLAEDVRDALGTFDRRTQPRLTSNRVTEMMKQLRRGLFDDATIDEQAY
jgi:hypothetical protein